MGDEPDVRPEDALQVAQRALSKCLELEDAVDELRGELDQEREERTKLALRVSEYDDGRDYDDLTRDDKVGRVREHAFDRALDAGGRTRLYYDDVQWSAFDGEPSPAHCYTLMELAAQDCPGFDYADPDSDDIHLRVDAERAKQSPAFYSAKKADRVGRGP